MPKVRIPSLDEYAAAIKAVAESIASDFTKPDDDFHPQMQLLPGDGSGIHVAPIPGQLLASPELKDLLAQRVMAPAIEAVGAKLMSWLMSAWSLEFEGIPRAEAMARFERAEREGIAVNPDRVEIVILTAIDAHRVLTSTAKIMRTAIGPPTLGPWEDWSDKYPTGVATGRFVEPLQAALRDSSGRPNPEFLRHMRGA